MLENKFDDKDNIIKTVKNVRVEDTTPESIKRLRKITGNDEELSPADKDIKQNKEIAALSYLWILSVPILLFRKDSPYIQRHAKQGLALFIVSIIFWFISTLPYIGWLGVILLMFYVFIIAKAGLKALIGEIYYIPFLTDILRPTTTEEEITLTPEELDNSVDNILNEEIIRQVSEKENTENKTIHEISQKVHDVLPDLEDPNDNTSLT